MQNNYLFIKKNSCRYLQVKIISLDHNITESKDYLSLKLIEMVGWFYAYEPLLDYLMPESVSLF